MRQLSNDEINRLKKAELEILCEIDRICMKYNIRYSLACGTLLGAVRHQGFIPWDDDIDVMFTRDEYEKFLTICKQNINSKFYLKDYRDDNNYALPFAKLMMRGTVMLEESCQYTGDENGIWVDLFPIDVSPINYEDKVRQYNKGQQIKRVLFCKCNYSFGKKGIKLLLYRMGKIRYLFRKKEEYVQQFEDNAKWYQDDNSGELVSLCGNVGVDDATFKRKWFESYVNLEFEGMPFRAICGYDEFLKQLYGDYLKLPSVEQRVPHHIVVDFKLREE